MSKELNTLNLANIFVMRRELAHINTLIIKVNGGDACAVDELVKEKIRLDPKEKWDEEEHFIGCLAKKNERTKRQ